MKIWWKTVLSVCIACLLLGSASSLAYAQGPGGDAGGSVANVNEDGTDQGGGAADHPGRLSRGNFQ